MQNFNIETYHLWKAECARKGKTPKEMVELGRSLGMSDEYLCWLQRFIEEMEALDALHAP